MEKWLKEIEEKNNIHILFAAETGSRVWGGATEQSDYDVRFIFLHRDVKTYLSLASAQEVFDFQSPYDAQGWDIFKAFTLLDKSNPSLLEWSLSPIKYRDSKGFSQNLYRYVGESYSLYSLYQHYIHLMKRNIKGVSFEDYSKQSQKKLIQAVRAFLLAKTIITTEKIPGTAIYSSFQGIFPEGDHLLVFYQELIKTKGQEELVPASKIENYISIMETERSVFDSQCRNLSHGENIRDKLNQWIWDLLGI